MRIRRNVIAPLILTIGAVGSLVAVPAVTALTAVASSTSAVVTGSASPNASSITAEIKSPASRLPPIHPIGWQAAGFGSLTAENFLGRV